MRVTEIKFAMTDGEIRACHPVMAELRTHLSDEEFVDQVKRQITDSGFQLVYLLDDGVKAVGGIRIAEWLASGKCLEIEDLVSTAAERSKGYGGALFDWIVDYGRQQDCKQIKLVSHVMRFAAHRFYLSKRMNLEAH